MGDLKGLPGRSNVGVQGMYVMSFNFLPGMVLEYAYSMDIFDLYPSKCMKDKFCMMYDDNDDSDNNNNHNDNDDAHVVFTYHDDVIKWKHFPRYWPFVRGIHRSPVNSPHKGQWRGALMFSMIFAWINGWVINRGASDWDATALIITSLLCVQVLYGKSACCCCVVFEAHNWVDMFYFQEKTAQHRRLLNRTLWIFSKWHSCVILHTCTNGLGIHCIDHNGIECNCKVTKWIWWIFRDANHSIWD